MIFWHGFFLLSALSVVNGKMFLINTEDKGAKKTAPKKNISVSTGSYPVATSADASEAEYPAPRILGGSLTYDYKTDFGWKVSLKIAGEDDSYTLCVGTIVDIYNILTAASCLQKGGQVATTDNVTAFTDSYQSGTGRELKLDSIEIHPEFVEGAAPNDLAVIKVASGEVDFNSSACLPRRPINDYFFKNLTIGGFGATSKRGYKRKDAFLNQNFVITTITLPRNCLEMPAGGTDGGELSSHPVFKQRRPDTDRNDANDESMNVFGNKGVFCARNKVSCYGDGGGPIFSIEKDCRTSILHGIARNDHSSDKPCTEDTKPGDIDLASLHTSIFYHLYKEDSWLCKTLGYRECKGVSVFKDRQPDDPDLA